MGIDFSAAGDFVTFGINGYVHLRSAYEAGQDLVKTCKSDTEWSVRKVAHCVDAGMRTACGVQDLGDDLFELKARRKFRTTNLKEEEIRKIDAEHEERQRSRLNREKISLGTRAFDAAANGRFKEEGIDIGLRAFELSGNGTAQRIASTVKGVMRAAQAISTVKSWFSQNENEGAKFEQEDEEKASKHNANAFSHSCHSETTHRTVPEASSFRAPGSAAAQEPAKDDPFIEKEKDAKAQNIPYRPAVLAFVKQKIQAVMWIEFLQESLESVSKSTGISEKNLRDYRFRVLQSICNEGEDIEKISQAEIGWRIKAVTDVLRDSASIADVSVAFGMPFEQLEWYVIKTSWSLNSI